MELNFNSMKYYILLIGLLGNIFMFSCSENKQPSLEINDFDSENLTVNIKLTNSTDTFLGYLGLNSVAFNKQLLFDYVHKGKTYTIVGMPEFSLGSPVVDYTKLLPDEFIEFRISLMGGFALQDNNVEDILKYLKEGGVLTCFFDNKLCLDRKDVIHYVIKSKSIKI